MANTPQRPLRHQRLPRLDQPGRFQQGSAEDGRVEEARRQAGLPEAMSQAAESMGRRWWRHAWAWARSAVPQCVSERRFPQRRQYRIVRTECSVHSRLSPEMAGRT